VCAASEALAECLPRSKADSLRQQRVLSEIENPLSLLFVLLFYCGPGWLDFAKRPWSNQPFPPTGSSPPRLSFSFNQTHFQFISHAHPFELYECLDNQNKKDILFFASGDLLKINKREGYFLAKLLRCIICFFAE